MAYSTIRFQGRSFFSITLALLFIFISCSKEDTEPTEDFVYPLSPQSTLIQATSCGEISLSTLKLILNAAGYSQFLPYVTHSIKIYKITYYTTFQEDTIVVSGLISYPLDAGETTPTMIVGSGLAYADDEVPSAFDLPDHYTGFEFIAALGYYTIIPDMIGYGTSSDLTFPIHNYEYSAKTMIDLIFAGKEFAEAKALSLSDKHFMAGYSQGGYIVMSAIKMIEEDVIEDIQIDATASGAGGYNLVSLLNYALDNNYYAAPAHILLLINSYNELYQWNRPLTDFFQEPYASQAPEWLSGKYNFDQINAQLPYAIDSLFNPVFLSDLQSENETDFIHALTENSVGDWTPHNPLNIIHSTGDESIPVSNSQEVYEKMIANGSTSVVFTTVDVPGHVAAGAAFVEKAVEWFSNYSE